MKRLKIIRRAVELTKAAVAAGADESEAVSDVLTALQIEFSNDDIMDWLELIIAIVLMILEKFSK